MGKKEARESLEKVIKALPLQLTDDQKTEVVDAVYDFVNNLLEAVAEEYYVVPKNNFG